MEILNRDIINPLCKSCDHLEDDEPYVCLTCKGGSHFCSLEEELNELKFEQSNR